jgi:ADP-ribose pyrophosphatase
VETARRELAEEAGVWAAEWSPLIAIHTSQGVTDERVQIFTARHISRAGGDDQPDADEGDIEASWIPFFADAVQMLCRGEVTDALAVAGLLAANS